MKKEFILVIILLGTLLFYSNLVTADFNMTLMATINSSTTGRFGTGVTSCDINNDGYEDVVVAADASGKVFAFYGKSDGINDLDHSDANITFYGAVGDAVACGDINNDGYYDIITGDFAGEDNTGKISVFFGDNYNIILQNEYYANLTFKGSASTDGVATALTSCDINNDGYDDIVAGAYSAPSTKDFGQVFVFFGENFTTIQNLSAAAYANITFNGSSSNSYFGWAVACGDVNNDYYGDIIVGAYGVNVAGKSQAGQVYVFFGDNYSTNINQLSTNYANITLNGNAAQDSLGISVGAGDVNKDGYDDILAGASLSSPSEVEQAGQAYVSFGSAYTSTINEDISTYANITLNATNLNDQFGTDIKAWDINNDNYDDLLVGIKYYNPLLGGVSIYLGNDYTSLINERAYGYANLTINGSAANDYFGTGGAYARSIGAGDVDNDGYKELIVGAPYADYLTIDEAGKVYIYSYEEPITVSAPTTPTITEPYDTVIGIRNSITYKCETSSTNISKWTWTLERPDGTTLTKTGGSETTDTITFTGDDDNVAGTYTVKCQVENTAGKATSIDKNFQVFYSTSYGGGEGIITGEELVAEENQPEAEENVGGGTTTEEEEAIEEQIPTSPQQEIPTSSQQQEEKPTTIPTETKTSIEAFGIIIFLAFLAVTGIIIAWFIKKKSENKKHKT